MRWRQHSPGPPGARIAVVSPHLDDAALSVGAAIARWTRRGSHVVVITVLANDPNLAGPASEWDRRAGFATRREAATKRRAEDERACAILGAHPAWLPFGDAEHPRGGTEAEICTALQQAVGDADVLLVPGYPLTHPGGDHLFVARIALALPERPLHVGLYAEQPYAVSRLVKRLARRPAPLPYDSRLEWTKIRPDLVDWRVKQAAIASYRSQTPLLGPFLRTRIAMYELAIRGEAIAWLPGGEAAPNSLGFEETASETVSNP
jgi:LmbE family N-acetylglucosaminyl deacetylase